MPKRNSYLFKKGLKVQEIKCSAYETLKDTEWVKLQLEKGELLIGCIYRSPSNKEDMNDQLYKLIKSAIQGRTRILLTGDLNHPQIGWENESSLQNNHKATIFLQTAVRDNFINMLKVPLITEQSRHQPL